MKKSPADALYLTLKDRVDEIIKQEDDETFVDADYDIAEGEGYFSLHITLTENLLIMYGKTV